MRISRQSIWINIFVIVLSTTAFAQSVNRLDYKYLIDATEVIVKTRLQTGELNRERFLTTARVACNALGMLAKDDKFYALLQKYHNYKLSDDDTKEMKEIIRSIRSFSQWVGKEVGLMGKVGLSEEAAGQTIGHLWLARRDFDALIVQPERVRGHINRAANQACAVAKDINADIMTDRDRERMQYWGSIVIGGMVVFINGSTLVPTGGFSALSVFLGGAIITG